MSSRSSTPDTIRVGYVPGIFPLNPSSSPLTNTPEHFSTPLYFAQSRGFFIARSLNVTLLPFPSGTGAMIKSLSSGSLDLAVGLTEGWIAALANGEDTFKLVGKYVDTPLCWAISTGSSREDILSSKDLEGKKRLGISRYGSGSYVMGYVLAEQNGWLSEEEDKEGKEPFEWVVLNDFKNLRDGVNKVHVEGKEADAFMWEHFTSKKYYDSGEIKRIGEIYTPWPSWHIVAHTGVSKSVAGIATVGAFLRALDEGVAYFNTHRDEAVEYISTQLDYSEEDAREWLRTVKFVKECKVVEKEVVEKTVGVLRKAGVVKGDEVEVKDMILDLQGYGRKLSR
ncbi:hypothetical protein BDD12DRAFT_804577 [Trichophaea hybrida]|nr:hypothetical protein BDD12DRAFT_804577 [Trichophaea hybrida]